MRQHDFKRRAYLHGYEPCLIAEIESEREWTPINTCEMPVVAIVGAVAGAIAGVGMVGAATGILGTIIGGALIVGGALTVIGTITGNENLTKIGGMLSLVGGVAGFAAGATGALGTNAAGGNFTMSDAFSQGMGKITDAFNGLTGATGTVNAGTEALNVNAGVTDVGGVSEAALQNAEGAYAPDMGASGGAGGPLTNPGGAAAPGGGPSTVGGPNAAGDATGSASTGAATESKGMLDRALKFANDNPGAANLIGQGLTGAAQGIGSYLSGQAEAEALEKLRKGEIKMASNGPLIIDPNSPNRAEWESYAQKLGVGTIQFGVDPNAPNMKMPSVSDNFTPPAITATGVTPSQYTPPKAPTVGLLRRAS